MRNRWAYTTEQWGNRKPVMDKEVPTLNWAYGITTVLERREDLFLQTLASLKEAGFDQPRLFVDGVEDASAYQDLGLEVTTRYPTIRTHGNWILSFYELYIRNPNADRYAIFQDDFVTYKGLREYLEHCEYPEKGYLNCYTFPRNQHRAPKNQTGWYLSDQLGKGAVALIFSHEAMQVLLLAYHMWSRPQNAKRGWRAVDGGIVDSFKKAGWREYVHNPSLVQHTGIKSSMGNRKHSLATSFKGEDFDVRSLL